MRMKSYFASSVQAAMEQARRELGSEATLVTSHSAGPEARHLGEYEVVFATDLPEVSAAGARGEVNRPADSRPATSTLSPTAADSMLAEIRDLGRLFLSWRQASIRYAEKPGWIRDNPQLQEAYAELIQAEVDPDLAQQLLAAAQHRLHPPDAQALSELPEGRRQNFKVELSRHLNSLERDLVRDALATEIRDSIRVDAELGGAGRGPRAVALVGPPGAGKTATIVKLALKFGVAARKSTLLISLDALRVGASEQLRRYASVLGIEFQALENDQALAQTLAEHGDRDLILIDTPGFSARELDAGCEAARFLAGRADIQKHLVLPAPMRFSDLARVSSAFDVFRPSRLIFSRLDETETFGPLLCEAMGSGRPISFLTTGQRVPDDLEVADKARLAELILPGSGKSVTRSLAAA